VTQNKLVVTEDRTTLLFAQSHEAPEGES